ncbi:hypothetical protein V500_00701, partial [Pseudogymnoascus sp. VKM F-4518 (FW-2643)]
AVDTLLTPTTERWNGLTSENSKHHETSQDLHQRLAYRTGQMDSLSAAYNQLLTHSTELNDKWRASEIENSELRKKNEALKTELPHHPSRYSINMAASTPTLEDGQSQTISDVDFSEWLTEDSSTPGSPDSDFDKLFSQNTMHIAASGSSHWRAVDWHSFDDFLKPELSKGEAIEQHQEPAEAILPEIAEATGADVIPATAPQEPADVTSPELTSQLAPQAIVPEVPLSPVKRKRSTSASSGPTRRNRRKTAVQEYVTSDRLFTSTALNDIDNLKEAQLKFKAASKDFEASQHIDDTMLRLMTLRTLIVNHKAMEEEAT